MEFKPVRRACGQVHTKLLSQSAHLTFRKLIDSHLLDSDQDDDLQGLESSKATEVIRSLLSSALPDSS